MHLSDIWAQTSSLPGSHAHESLRFWDLQDPILDQDKGFKMGMKDTQELGPNDAIEIDPITTLSESPD